MGVCVRVVELHGEQQPYCTCVGSYCLSWVDSPILHRAALPDSLYKTLLFNISDDKFSSTEIKLLVTDDMKIIAVWQFKTCIFPRVY